MGEQERLVNLSDPEIIVKEEDKEPILIADDYIANNFCEEEPLQKFEEYGTGLENDVDPLGHVGGKCDENLQVPRDMPGNANSVTQELPLKQPPSLTIQKIQPSTCQKCNLIFPIPSILEHHVSTFHADDLPHTCSICSKRFASPHNLKRHETIHNPERLAPFACDLCDKRYHHKKNLKAHREKCNFGYKPPIKGTEEDPIIEHHSTKGTKKIKPTEFPCPHCDRTFQNNYLLKRHQTSHTNEKPFQCSICQQPFSRKCSLQRHIGRVHQNPPPKWQRGQPHPCNICGKTFQMRWLLQRHMGIHTGEKSYESHEQPVHCSICQQPYTQKSSLLKHIRTVHENPTPSGKVHPPPRWQRKQPQTCNLCGKIFRTPWQLRNHMLLHTGEKPYECQECGMRFRLTSSLRLHEIQHAPPDTTGMTTFKCRICGKEGIRKFGLLRDHRMKAHKHIPWEGEGEKAFACGICGKPYYQRYKAVTCAILGHDPSSLEKAMFKHKCPECPPESFGYHHLAYLRRHWEEEHTGKVLPGELRARMYSVNLKPEELPRVTIGRGEAEKIRENGSPPVTTEFPLCIELDLLPIPEKEWFRNTRRMSAILKMKPSGSARRKSSFLEVPWCDICTIRFSSQSNLQRHLKVVHGQGKLQTNIKTEPTAEASANVSSTEAVELLGVRNTVNVKDEEAVRRLIGSRTVQINLVRLEEDDDAFEWAFSNGVKIRQMDSFLISRIC